MTKRISETSLYVVLLALCFANYFELVLGMRQKGVESISVYLQDVDHIGYIHLPTAILFTAIALSTHFIPPLVDRINRGIDYLLTKGVTKDDKDTTKV